MNTKSIITVSLLVMSSMLVTAPSYAADLKIGVVNVTRLLEAAPQAEDAQKKLEREFATRDKKLLAEQKAIKKLEDKLIRDAAIMSEAEGRKKDRDIRNRKRELRRALDELREDKTIRTNEELGKLQKIVNEAIQDVGKSENFDLVLYEGIAFVNPRLNLTQKILERLKLGMKKKPKQ